MDKNLFYFECAICTTVKKGELVSTFFFYSKSEVVNNYRCSDCGKITKVKTKTGQK